jgi:hypothetical protein
MGQAERVLDELDGPGGLLARLDRLPAHSDPTDIVVPSHVRERMLEIAAGAAEDLGRWARALELYGSVQASKRSRGASAHETARTRFNDHTPLIRLGRLDEAEALLADCQQVFIETGDSTALGAVLSARAELAAVRGRYVDAATFEQEVLRHSYTHSTYPDVGGIAASHHNLAGDLARIGAEPAVVLAHRLAATLVDRLAGSTDSGSLRALSAALATAPEGTTVPVTVAALAAAVEQVEDVRFAAVVDALCPDRTAASLMLRDIIHTARGMGAFRE